MIQRIFVAAVMALCALAMQAKSEMTWVDTPFGKLPSSVYFQIGKHHVQGVAVDVKNKCVYFSFTTYLIKTDYEGNLLGSVEGLTCHLGCIDLDPETGMLYGSMEYKDDAIGQGISGSAAKQRANSFYVGIFDTKKIDHPGIDAATGGVLKAAYLKEVVDMYETKVQNDGKTLDHKYGCSGIDGVSLGPQFGKTDGRKVINVALGIYSDVDRTDNDYQVILQYDPAKLEAKARPLTSFHQYGPKKADKRYFVFTGNTNWGVQNMDYDAYKGYWILGVYKGKKSAYPNYSMFAVDGSVAAKKETLKGFVPAQKGLVLTLANDGSKDAKTGLRGWNAKCDTGIESLGQGYYYISNSGKTKDKVQFCDLRLCKWTGNPENPFEELK